MARTAIKPYPAERDIPLALSFDDVLLLPRKSTVISRGDVNLSSKIAKNFELKFPVMSTMMDTVTGVEMAIAVGKYGGLGILPRFDSSEKQSDKVAKVKKKEVRVAAAVGCREGFMERAQMLVAAGVDVLVLDVAHGHMITAIAATKVIKENFPEIPLISGVIATYEGAYDLFKSGADAVQVGVGPGSICVTREVAGVGVPQITAVTEATEASKKFKNRYVVVNAGMKTSGDVVKALAAGADAVLSGNLFAGSRETPGKVIKRNGKLYKEYHGSTSEKEKRNHLEKNGEQRSEHYIDYIEGVEALVPYKGPVERVLRRVETGIRSGFSYCGAHNLQELHKSARFIRITAAGKRESGAHDVQVL